jgi:hypothetical protein
MAAGVSEPVVIGDVPLVVCTHCGVVADAPERLIIDTPRWLPAPAESAHVSEPSLDATFMNRPMLV